MANKMNKIHKKLENMLSSLFFGGGGGGAPTDTTAQNMHTARSYVCSLVRVRVWESFSIKTKHAPHVQS